MLSGTIIIETVFSWPGLGRLIVQAVPGRDFPVIQAGGRSSSRSSSSSSTWSSTCCYAVVDPRVRVSS